MAVVDPDHGVPLLGWPAAASYVPMATVATPSATESGRLKFIDVLRALSSHLLVWHHLAFYGPLAEQAYPLAPVLLDWLADPARFVVQVFLVIGGFGTANHLTRLHAPGWRQFILEVARRYRRIGLPYVVMLPVAIGANALAGHWMNHHSISAVPSMPQLAAHVLFLQDLLRYEPLSAGIWYLGIDFQLFLLTLSVAMLSLRWTQANGVVEPARALTLTQSALAVPAVLSLFWFNRDPSLDCWGIYFFGSYFLGMVVRWVTSGSLPGAAFWGYLWLVAASLAVDWRPRLIVAASTALSILLASQGGWLQRWPDSRAIGYLGRISFSLFLIHFPACLVVSGWLSQWSLTPSQALAGMVAAWGASVILAVALHHLVERPCWQRRSA